MTLGHHRHGHAGPARQFGGPDVLRADHHGAGVVAFRRGHTHHAAVFHQQLFHVHVFADGHATAARAAREAGGHQIGIGKARFRFKADQRRVVERGNGQQLAGLGGVQQFQRNALFALLVQRALQGRQLVVVGGGDQITALDQAAGRFVVTDVAGEVVEHVPGTLRQLHVFAHRIMGAQNTGRLRRRARADGRAVQHQHVLRAQLRQVERHRTADHAGTNHDHVITFHDKAPRTSGASVNLRCLADRNISIANT
ncbi:hypothetical protein D3C72_1347850 [compost metagenome]